MTTTHRSKPRSLAIVAAAYVVAIAVAAFYLWLAPTVVNPLVDALIADVLATLVESGILGRPAAAPDEAKPADGEEPSERQPGG